MATKQTRWRPAGTLATVLGALVPVTAVAVASLALSEGAAAAEPYPSRPIKLIVGYTPGGPVDTAARIYADYLGRVLKQPVVVDNRAGASGAIAAEITAKAPPDGYTLYFVASPTMTMTPLIQKAVNFNPTRDFSHIGLITDYTNVLLINKDFPARNVGELVEYARKHPQGVAFGSAGVGASNHLSAELLAQMSGVKMLHVPYKGNSPAMTDVISGKIAFMFDITGTAIGHIQGGKVRPLAVTSKERNAALPNVPTMVESGLKDYAVTGWYALIGPPKLPAEVVDTLVKAQQTVGDDAAFRQRMTQGGYDLNITGPKPLAERIERELRLWSGVVKTAKIEVE
ncbi:MULTISPECIES: tripartite tricarboxylate transporter substrate binding protein [Cupriavidus]|uniref:Bug family tripartite tricarboxylate transporter substrate binding protein n=1 Tax=Cupriavidus TaxID=106589 RepID=UPI0002915A00|nr:MULTISPECIES: tripartite tricarboxylate transporter substrate binding protein [Cupriavidus]ESH85464.1 ABC transporter substrate-binding protein [Cupriavidus sp. HPC(L)]MCD9121652.1 tripartite tricarboxylate transporter substrate binding protein [Cupriavidus sp. UGS-1]